MTYAHYELTDVMTGDNTVFESLGDLCPLGPLDVVDLNAAKTHEIEYRSARAPVRILCFMKNLSLVHWAARGNRHLISGT